MRSLATLCAAVLAILATPRVEQPAPSDRQIAELAYRSNNTGAAWLEQFQFGKAAEAFREALRRAPRLAVARFNLGLALYYDGRLDAAELEARQAAAALGTPHAQYLLGLIARAAGRAEAAAAAFSGVLQRDPDDATAAILLGQLELQLAHAPGAVKALEHALALEPYNATAAYNLSLALTRAGRTEDGRKMLARFQALRDSGTATSVGNGYLEQGKYAEAIVSTGAEPDLVSPALPAVRFIPESLTTGAGRPPQRPRDPPPASPFNPVGQRFDSRDLDAAGRARIAAALSGAVTLLDYDGDGDLDLLEAGPDGEHLWRNTNGHFTPVAGWRLPRPTPAAVATGLVPGDYNNDGRTDLLVLRYGGPALYRNDGNGRFTDVTRRAGLRSGPAELPMTAAFVDLDHDGDLDIVVPGFVELRGPPASRPLRFPEDFPAAPTRVWRNNGNGTFTDVTDRSGISGTRSVAIVATDFDLRRDVDLFIADADGRLRLFKNQRDGSFQAVERQAGVPTGPTGTGLTAGDVNRDGRTDLLVTSATGQPVMALSADSSRFRFQPLRELAAAQAAQFVDYDDDGLLDVVAWSAKGATLLRSLGTGWQEVPGNVIAAATRDIELPSLAPGRAIAVADIDGDGDPDFVVRGRNGMRVLRNEGGNRGGALTLRLAGLTSNRGGTGSKIEVRSGGLLQRRETSLSTPAAAPFDLVVGLGGRRAVDAVRVLWPSGIVQAEMAPDLQRPLLVRELDRKPSSCPYLFTWNGQRFQFVTDFLGGGELGYWEAPGVRGEPDPDEYVRIPDGALQPTDGRYAIRVTNELEEVLFLDRLQLVAVTHPPGTEVYPNEGLVSPPFSPAVLSVVRNRRPALAVFDGHGHDAGVAARDVDRRYIDDFGPAAIRGYADPHTLTIRVDDRADFLLLTGWTDYAFSSDNVAASQQGLALAPPGLQVRDGEHGWRTAVEQIGVPVGRPQTIVVDLRRVELRGHREFRIRTNLRIHWDRVAVADADPGPFHVTRLDPVAARLRWRGFSRAFSADGLEPLVYDYQSVSAASSWKIMPGRYTPEGDVRPLVTASDDRFVIARPGDEIAVEFDAAPVPASRRGSARTFLLYADGFSKEMDLHSASPDGVEPLPFHGMETYPPVRRKQATPLDTEPATGNARVVTRAIPSLDTLLLKIAGTVPVR